MALRVDDPQRQPCPAESRRAEGRRPPGLVRVGRFDHDGALFRDPAAAGPRRGEAARRRRCSTPSTTCSAGRRGRSCEGCGSSAASSPIRRRVKDGPEVDFSTGSVGLGVAMTTFAALMQDYVRLHGLGRADMPAGPPHRHRRRCRAGRGQYLRGVAGGLEARRPQCLVDHRLQPPEPRLRRARPAVRPHRGPVPRHGLERRHHQIRPQAGGRLRARGRRGAAPLDRRLPELALLRADLPGRRRLAAERCWPISADPASAPSSTRCRTTSSAR